MPPRKVKQSVFPSLLSVLKTQKNPPIQPDLLQRGTDSDILSLDAEDADQFWKDMNSNFKVHLQILIPEEPLQEEGREEENKKDESLEFMKLVLYLLEQKANTADPYIPVIAVQMLIVLNGLILNPVFDEQLKIQTVKLCETWWKKNLSFRDTLGENTIHFLLLKSLQSGAPKNVVSRVFALRESLKENFRLERFLTIFSQISQNHNYLSSKDGQSFLGFIMALDHRIIRCIHDSAKLFIVNNKKAAAIGYGRVYFLAWHSASGNRKKVIEEKCIQEFMEHVFTLSRQGLEMSQLGLNIFVILKEFHSHKILSHVRSMLTDLYEPLLWRYLRSSNNIYRCNAAQVLFDVYPLERPGDGREEGFHLILKQHRIMEELLVDEYHVVRLIAVKGICRILSEYWEVISPDTIQKWMQIIVQNLVNDGSCPKVRQSVYIGFKYLVKKPISMEYMQQLLPKLQNHFHDVNSRVRVAFVDMLLACKENGIKYWNIVPLTHLLSRLEVEETDVGCLIVKLLFNSFYIYERGPHVTFKRIMNLILMNRNASRMFFRYSKPSLNTERAIQLMISILAYMLQHVNTKLGINTNDDGSNEPQSPEKKKQKASSKRQNNESNSSHEKENIETTAAEKIPSRNGDIYSEASLDNPIVSQGFIDIVIILWKTHATNFDEAENKTQAKKFYKLCSLCLPPFLKYYKETDVYGSLLFLCGVMPLPVMKIIRPLCNIESICLSQLKALTMDSSDEEILRLVQPLCFWNHGEDILETARLWIDDAFRIDDLNASFCKPRSDKRRVKIKDIHEPKPLLGFRLLNAILSHIPTNELILTKSYSHVLELRKYLERIKILIENRIRNGETYNHPLLCDRFIEECFSRYLKLILHLKRKSEDNTFDACQTVTDIIDWAERCLIQVLPIENPLVEESSQIEWIVIETSGPLLVNLLNEILKVATNLIISYKANIGLCSKVIRFTKLLLSTGCKIKFVYCAMGLLFQIYKNDFICQLDKWHLFKILMPLFNNCIDSFSDVAYSKDTINRYVESFIKIRNAISTFLRAALKELSISSSLFKDTTGKFVDVMVKIISKDHETLEHVHTFKKIQELPYITAQFAYLFLNKKNLFELLITKFYQNFEMKYSKDPKLTASALGLLRVLILCQGRVSLNVLSSAVKKVDDVLNGSGINYSDDSVDCNRSDFVSISHNLIKDMKKYLEKNPSKSRTIIDGIEDSLGPKQTDTAISLDNCDAVQTVPTQMISASNENVHQSTDLCKGVLEDEYCKTTGNTAVCDIKQIGESCLESSQLSVSLTTKKRKLYTSNTSSLTIPENEKGNIDINKSKSDKCTNNIFTYSDNKHLKLGAGAVDHEVVPKCTCNNSGLVLCNHQQHSSFVAERAISNISILSPRSNSLVFENRTCDMSVNNCISEKQSSCLGTTTNNTEDSLRTKKKKRKSSPNTSETRKSLRIASQNATESRTCEVQSECKNLTSIKITENNESVIQSSFVHNHKRKLFSPNSKGAESIRLNFTLGDVNASFNGICSFSNIDEPLTKNPICNTLTKISINEKHKKQNIKGHSEHSSLDMSGIEEIRGVDINESSNLTDEIAKTNAVQDTNSGKEVPFVGRSGNTLIKSPLSSNEPHQRSKETSFQNDNRKSDQSNRKRRSSRISDSHTRNDIRSS